MNKKHLLFVLFLVFLTACEDNEDIDCSLVDCAFQSFSIEFVDAEGNNLITNGTYGQSQISVTKDGAPLNSNLDTSDMLYFEIDGKVGLNTYEIKLNNSETDILVLDLSGENVENSCCGPYFPINRILYNEEEQGTGDESDFYHKKITITK